MSEVWKVGDHVDWYTGGYSGRTAYGVITRITDKGTVYVRERGCKDEESKAKGQRLRRTAGPTVATLDWCSRLPRTKHVVVRHGWRDTTEVTGVDVTIRSNPMRENNYAPLSADDLAEAARELAEVAAWYATKPKRGE